jgi:hypothetical protein
LDEPTFYIPTTIPDSTNLTGSEQQPIVVPADYVDIPETFQWNPEANAPLNYLHLGSLPIIKPKLRMTDKNRLAGLRVGSPCIKST